MPTVLYQLLNDKYFKNLDESSEYYQICTNKIKKISEVTLSYYPNKSHDEILNLIDTLIFDIEFSLENYVYFIPFDDSHKFIMWLKDCKKILIQDEYYNNYYNNNHDECTIVINSSKTVLIFINKIKLKFPTYIGNNYNKFDDNFIIKKEFDIFPPSKKYIYPFNHKECLYVNNILTNINYKVCDCVIKL